MQVDDLGLQLRHALAHFIAQNHQVIGFGFIAKDVGLTAIQCGKGRRIEVADIKIIKHPSAHLGADEMPAKPGLTTLRLDPHRCQALRDGKIRVAGRRDQVGRAQSRTRLRYFFRDLWQRQHAMTVERRTI